MYTFIYLNNSKTIDLFVELKLHTMSSVCMCKILLSRDDYIEAPEEDLFTYLVFGTRS